MSVNRSLIKYLAKGLTSVLLLLPFVLIERSYGQFDINGYVEPANSTRFSNSDPIEDRTLLWEVRTMLENQLYGRGGEGLSIRVLVDHNRLDGTTVELREGKVTVPIGMAWEFSIGRQVLSWGPAQYEFVNDRFTKDFRSFFLGRDLEFLKAPDDAVRISWFPGWADIDVVWIPIFNPDRIGEGRMIPVFNPVSVLLVGGDEVPQVSRPGSDIDDGEIHMRIRRLVGRWELAAYGYRGFTGIPEGFENEMFFHPEMLAAGISSRGPIFNGTGWMEMAYEDIRDPRAGKIPEVSPDRLVGLIGYEIRPSPVTRYMVQGMWSGALDAGELRNVLRSMEREDDSVWSEKNRFFLQLAAGRSFLEERLNVTLRGFWGITDEDGHARLELRYEWSDALNLYAGVHGFMANNSSSRFGAVDKHDLVYMRVRYGF